METTPFGRYTVQQSSKKRAFPGGDSRSNLLKPREEALSSFAYNHSYAANSGSGALGQHKSYNSKSYCDDFLYNDDEHLDKYLDNITYDRDHDLQAHFDSRGIPPGDEAPVPWFLAPSHTENIQSGVNGSKYSSPTLQTEPGKLNPPFSRNINSFGSAGSVYSDPRPKIDRSSFTYTTGPPLPLPFYYGNYTPPPHDTTAYYSSHSQAGSVRPSYGFGPSYMASYPYSSSTKSFGNGTLSWPPTPPSFYMPTLPMGPPPSSMDTPMPSWFDSLHAFGQPTFESDDMFSTVGALPLPYERDLSPYQDPVRKNASAAGSSSVPPLPDINVNEKDIIEKFQNFKQFDTVEDFSDHLFVGSVPAVKQPPKDWAKRIQEEWKILEKNLPDKIYVRVFESRIDLLRAAIVGAEGTPYHDGLFFFDLSFPIGYPNVPPLVMYHSFGLGINPNLYDCGKVCLSLLNTWSGNHQNEQWIPGVSTILQVLVSIQALILNEKPYFNEPGFEYMSGSPIGEMQSQHYNESVFTLSLRTMLYSIRKSPKHFEDFVVGHFLERSQDILGACKAYLEGVQVGCLVHKGGTCNKGCSQNFGDLLGRYIPKLVQTFSQIGAKDLEQFLLADKGKAQISSMPLPCILADPSKLF